MSCCTKCTHSYAIEDIVDGVCFRCRYRDKVTPIKENTCKLCKVECVEKGYSYCSAICRNKAKSIQVKQYWTRKINVPRFI